MAIVLDHHALGSFDSTLRVERPSLPVGVSGVPHLYDVLSLSCVGDSTNTSVVDEIGRLATRAYLAHDSPTVDTKNLRKVIEHIASVCVIPHYSEGGTLFK